MPDRDRVIGGLCAIVLVADKDDPVAMEQARICWEAVVLLKEQESATRDSAHGVYPEYINGIPSCGHCGGVLAAHYRNCPWCGKEVKWYDQGI